MKAAPILLLDEPASALDQANDRQVSAASDRLRGSCTVVMVTHHLPTIREVDQVIVLEGGRLVESGTPAELEGLRGYFARAVAGAAGERTLPR